MSGRPDRDDRDLFYWLALRMAPGVGSRRFGQLLKKFKTPKAVFSASLDELARFPRLPRETVQAIHRFDWGRDVEKEMARARQLGCKLITLKDASYPRRLKEIYDPPPVLWTAGEMRPEDEAAVAIVGSRTPTDYGRRMAARLAADLASAGINVVSGVALGIDAAAHRGTLAAGGRTTGVLGCGLDVVYPRPNRDLYNDIPVSGVLMSEFSLGTTPERSHFPVRNRIIAGLSIAVVVVEAGAKSGALITARLALDQNRDVLAVPGRAGSARSRGSHALLKEGARLVESGQDILDEIAPQIGERRQAPAQGREEAPGPEAVEGLSDPARRVLQTMGPDPVHVDDLGRQAGLSPPGLAPLMLDLELKGLVRQLPGMRYIKEG